MAKRWRRLAMALKCVPPPPLQPPLLRPLLLQLRRLRPSEPGCLAEAPRRPMHGGSESYPVGTGHHFPLQRCPPQPLLPP